MTNSLSYYNWTIKIPKNWNNERYIGVQKTRIGILFKDLYYSHKTALIECMRRHSTPSIRHKQHFYSIENRTHKFTEDDNYIYCRLGCSWTIMQMHLLVTPTSHRRNSVSPQANTSKHYKLQMTETLNFNAIFSE
jgi:hypothetical protein